jgi:hypothetical protein
MKTLLSLLVTGLLLGAMAAPGARAQDSGGQSGTPGGNPGGGAGAQGPGGGMGQRMMAGLTDAEKQQLMAARQKALADNPQLQQEMKDLQAKHQAAMSPDADPSAREGMMKAFRTYMQDMHAAMLKADPTIGPVLDKVDANRKAMMGGGGGQPGGAGQ